MLCFWIQTSPLFIWKLCCCNITSLNFQSTDWGLYQSKVNSTLTSTQRPGHWAQLFKAFAGIAVQSLKTDTTVTFVGVHINKVDTLRWATGLGPWAVDCRTTGHLSEGALPKGSHARRPTAHFPVHGPQPAAHLKCHGPAFFAPTSRWCLLAPLQSAFYKKLSGQLKINMLKSITTTNLTPYYLITCI